MSTESQMIEFQEIKYTIFLPHWKTDYIQSFIYKNASPYELNMLKDMSKYLDKDSLVLDIGANIGNHSLYLTCICGCQVIAYEPNVDLTSALINSADINGVTDRLEIVPCAVSDEKGTGKFLEHIPDNLGAQKVTQCSEKGQFKTIRLDDQKFDSPITLMKIDVEGFELSVLRGAKKTINTHKPVIYIECVNEDEFRETFELLGKYGYLYFDSFNATPTHLFIHKQQVSTQEKNEADLSRIIHQIYELTPELAKMKKANRTDNIEIKNFRRCLTLKENQADKLTKSLENTTETLKISSSLNNELEKQIQELKQQKLNNDSVEQELTKQIQALKQQKLKSSMERSLFPKTTARLRRAVRMTRSQGIKATTLYYLKAISRGIKSVPSGETVIGHKIVQSLKKFSVKQLSNLDDDIKVAVKKASKLDFVIICNGFPGKSQPYGGEFIRTRYEAYLAAGFNGDIIHISGNLEENEIEAFEGSGRSIIRIHAAHLHEVTKILASGACKIFTHSPAPETQKILQRTITKLERLTYWFHGYEVRDYRRLYFNYSTEEVAVIRSKVNQVQNLRVAANRVSFENSRIKKIFVSDYLKNIAELDMGTEIKNGHIVPNYINSDIFRYKKKNKDSLNKFLLIRSFARRNYANDIAIEAIKIASLWDGFDQLHFTVRGFGGEFTELVDSIRHLSNVDIKEQYSNPEQMAELHGTHGVFLCPSRFDTQGVTMGEAMSSGLLCISNAATGITEFIDNSCGILVPGNDPIAFAKAIWAVKQNPAEMLKRSQLAQQRVRKQCGFDETISREIDITLKSNKSVN